MSGSEGGAPHQGRKRRAPIKAWAAIALMIGLRLFRLDSDAYPRLSWSAALLTDEGFYIHNARNVVLFGQARTDDFNNFLIMPTLHYLQVAVFSLFGVGAVQARLISVVLSLLTLTIFFAALRRAFGATVAVTGTLLFGLDHTNLLYNRLALMDTPAAFLMACAFYAFVRGEAETAVCARESPAAFWWAACGLLLGVSYVTRGLSALLIPVPLWLLWSQRRSMRRSMRSRKITAAKWSSRIDVPVSRSESALKTEHGSWTTATTAKQATAPCEGQEDEGQEDGPAGPSRYGKSCHTGFLALVAGLTSILVLYGMGWYLPHRAELARVNAYYLNFQLRPHSVRHLFQNVSHALVGDDRGMSPYLMRHTPVQFTLALAWFGWRLREWFRRSHESAHLPQGRKNRPSAKKWRETGESADSPALTESMPLATRFLEGWLLLAWIFYAVISYSPSRYYVLFYPAMAAVSALALANLRAIGTALRESAWLRAALGGFLIYHLLEAILHHASRATNILLYSVTAAAIVVAHNWRRFAVRVNTGTQRAPAIALLLWAVINACWTGDWLAHLTYAQRDADAWLARNLPSGSVLIGDVAPGLCLNNRFKAVNVIWKLCNDQTPVERYAPAPRAILILDGKWKENWWRSRYPELIASERRIHLFPCVCRFPVGVYAVPQTVMQAVPPAILQK